MYEARLCGDSCVERGNVTSEWGDSKEVWENVGDILRWRQRWPWSPVDKVARVVFMCLCHDALSKKADEQLVH